MDRYEIDRYESLLRKRHEAKAQELRYTKIGAGATRRSEEIPANQTGCRSDPGRTSCRLKL
jgi:hypothetical protein